MLPEVDPPKLPMFHRRLASRLIAGDPARPMRAMLRREMIYPYSNETQTRWDRGDFEVQLSQPENPRPLGFCDGSNADVAELQEMAESEGASSIRIEKKRLKSGREIWTLHGES